MNTFYDLSGQHFGKLTVIRHFSSEMGRLSGREHRIDRWLCRCECGEERIARSDTLKRGTSYQCRTCANRTISERRISHGQATRIRGVTSEYSTWSGMIARCYNSSNLAYANYGGRGITVCDEWRGSFGKFYADMGPRPSSNHSLDRIDNDGNYSKNNCRWASRDQQGTNKRTNVRISFNGENLTATEWSKKTGIKMGTIIQRLKSGRSLEEVFSPDYLFTGVHDWEKGLQIMGKIPDREVAKIVGCTPSNVGFMRKRHGIPSYRSTLRSRLR